MYYVWRKLRLLISDMQFTLQIIINMPLDAATLILPNLEKFDKYGLHFRFLHTSSYISLFFTSSLYLPFCTFTSSFPYLLISDFFTFYFHSFTLLYSVPLFTSRYISLFFTSSLYLPFRTFTSSFPYLLISDFFLFYFHLFTLLYSVPSFTQYFHYSFYVAVPNTSQNGTDYSGLTLCHNSPCLTPAFYHKILG